MAQVPNLLDMIRNNRDADKAQAAKPADVKLSAKTGKASRTLLPIDPVTPGAGADKSNGGKTASFQAKVDKSRAKLAAAVNHKSPAQPKPAAKTDTAKPAKSEPEARTEPVRTDRSEKPARRDREDSAPQTIESKSAAPSSEKSTQPDLARDASAPAKDMDAETVARIQDGLEDMGIQVDDAQMNDPAFLMEMLRLLQAMPVVQADTTVSPAADASEVAVIVPQGEASQVVLDPGAEVEGKTEAVPAAQTEKPLSRKDLADLIAGRLDGMQVAAQAEKAGAPQVSAQAPTVTRKEWQGIQVRPQTETIATDPLPMADLDRLRVLQAAALQAGPKAGENANADFSIETDSADPISDASAAVPAAPDRESSADGQDTQADLFGRNGDQTGNAEASARKEGPLVAKEGATGPQFNQALEQARTVDHRASIQRGMEPRAGGTETALLEQIAKKMSAVARKNGDEINIQLSPEHLGKVRVSLEMKEGAMMARIAVENDNVRKQVEDNLGSLKDALANQGIKLQGLEVSVDQRHSSLFNPDGSNSESFFHRRGQGGEGGPGERENAGFESAPEAETGRRWGYNTMEYIG